METPLHGLHTTVRDVKLFLGPASFYRRFIKGFSKKALSLSNLLLKVVVFDFTNKCKKAFDDLKYPLTNMLIKQPPWWEMPFEIMCGATDYAVRAALG